MGVQWTLWKLKHRKCFAPKAIEIWGLQDIEAKFIETWNMVNLYSKTRGINRFKSLAKTFELLKEDGIDMPDFSSVNKWIEISTELSNPALEKAILQTKDEQLVKVLEWSNAVNKAIRELHLHTLFGEIGGITHGSNEAEKIIIEELEKVGFEVTLIDGTSRDKGKTAEVSQNFDAALIFADIVGYAAENNYQQNV